jgi:hypothetical protein
MSAPKVIIEEVNDPELAAKLKAQDEKFHRNPAVFDTHAQELFTQHRGKVIVIVGEELHVADTTKSVPLWDADTTQRSTASSMGGLTRF